jgi:hypothetical protein
MGAGGRHINLELSGLTLRKCQIHGTVPIIWHNEICESSCVCRKSHLEKMLTIRAAAFRGRGEGLDQDAVKFLKRRESEEIVIRKCLADFREWKEIEGTNGNRWRSKVALLIPQVGIDD